MGRSGFSLALLVVALAAWAPHAAGASYGQTVAELGSRSVRVGSADDGVAGAPRRDGTQDDPSATSATAARSLLRMSKKNTHARPDFSEGIYHTKGDVFDEVKAIVAAHPDIMRIDTAQSTRGGYSSELFVVTVELAGLEEDDFGDARARLDDVDAKASGEVSGTGADSSAPKVEKTRVLYNFGEHGRELITVEVAVDLLRALAGGAESAARLAHPDASESTRTTARALLATTFKIVPMENVNGRDKVEAGEWCERKNGRGVDCNRNWEVDWGVKAPDYDPSEEYPGTAPFSEPEAFMMKTLLEEFRPHVWVNVHSGMEAMFMPFDHKAEEPVGPGADAMKAILGQINAHNCGNRCVVGGGGKGVGYLAHGTATDHVYVKMRVPVTFTWEIYGDTEAHYLDCFRMFNPVERDHRDAVVKDWVSAAIGLVPMTRAHPDVPMARALLEGEPEGASARTETARRRLDFARRRFVLRRRASRLGSRRRGVLRVASRRVRVSCFRRARVSGRGVRAWVSGNRRRARRRGQSANYALAAIRVAVRRRRDSRGERLRDFPMGADGLRGGRRGVPCVPVRGGAAHAPRAARGPDRRQGREETLAVTTQKKKRGGCGGGGDAR